MNSIINQKSYPNCCEVITKDYIFIKDVKNKQCDISTENDYHLKILNPKNQNISFLKIDKCVFDDSDDENFIEYKEWNDWNETSDIELP